MDCQHVFNEAKMSEQGKAECQRLVRAYAIEASSYREAARQCAKEGYFTVARDYLTRAERYVSGAYGTAQAMSPATRLY